MKSIFATCACVIMSWNVAQADLIDTDIDSYVERGTADNNYGTSQQLRLKHNTDNFVRKSYVRFDLSALSFDHTTELGSATLSLNLIDTGAGANGFTNDWSFAVYGLNDGDAGEGWGESTITWNNAPQNDTTNGNGVLANTTALGTFSIVGRTGTVDFSNTAVRDFVAASSLNDQVTFIVVRDTLQPSGTVNYVHAAASSEHTSVGGPSLNLTPAIPEPSSLGLMLLGLVGLRLVRRGR